MTTIATIDALCLAIDAGDDSLIPILADALEEAGDRRADGLRRIGDKRPTEEGGSRVRWAWIRDWAWGRRWSGYGTLTVHVYDMLRGGIMDWADRSMSYPTRSAAILALAAALVED